MKKRLIFIPLIIFTLFLSVIFPVFAGLKAEPVVRSPFDFKDKYDTDLYTGSAGYSYEIKVPKGTNDLTPDVSLVYNSAGAKDFMQRSGLGWQLNQDYIQRDVNFTPDNTSDDKFKLYFKGTTYDLVYAPSDNRYHTKIESNLRIEKKPTSNYYGEHWVVTDQNGTQYRFGTTYLSSEETCDTRAYTRAWNIDQVEDTHGNKIYYTYFTDSGLRYLSKIEYNNEKSRSIEFNYTASPYQRQLYLQGCPTNETKRLSNIQVKTNTNLVYQYDFNYITAANSQQLLQSITEKGSDGAALPTTAFDYKPEIKGWQSPEVKWLDNADVDVNIADPAARIIDVNGDALSDIVKSQQNGGSDTWKVLINTGNSSWQSVWQIWINDAPIDSHLDSPDTRLIDVNGDNLPDIVKTVQNGGNADWKVLLNTGSSWNTTWQMWVNNAPIDAHLMSPTTMLIDVTGDNLPDILRLQDNGTNIDYKVFRNTGSSWNTNGEMWINNLPFGAKFTSSDTRLIDANSDGLTDFVKTSSNGTYDTWSVYKNTGSSWQLNPEVWINNANVDTYIGNPDSTIVDVNADGLPDIVKSDDLGSADRWKVLLNQGNSWSTTWETWIDPSQGVDIDVHNLNTTTLSDVTGDGLPDIVKSEQNGGRDTWKVWKNNGYAPELLSKITTSQGGTVSFDYIKSTAIPANSNPDLPFPLWLVEKMTTNNGMTNTHGTNDITTYFYQNGLYDWQDREFRGFGTVDENLPTTKKKYVFNQDDALKGKPAEIQTRDLNNNPFAETEYTWNNSQANNVYTVSLASEKNYTYDGTITNPKVTQTDYEYDGYGNITKKSELGDTGTTGDEKYTYNEYVYNTTAWIINKLAHTTLKSSDDTNKVAEQWKYYDNDPNASSSAGTSPIATAFGDGSNGDLTISSNTTENPIDSYIIASAGSTTATVGFGLGLTPNQIVLLHQTQGTNTGAWEYARVQLYTGSNLILSAPLTNSYSTSGNNHAQVRLVPQYHDVTVNSGATWSPKAWDGSTGGILTFLADGTVTINGTINAAGKGYRRSETTNSSNGAGFTGEGTSGPGGTQQVISNGNGGGGGGYSNNYPWNQANGGGGGANSRTNGTDGIATGGGNNAGGGGGALGDAKGTPDLTMIVFGGAGGGGGRYDSSNTNGKGGNGGGIIYITGSNVVINGTIVTSGNQGEGNVDYHSGAGGSGAGGSIFVKAQNAALGTTLLTALGGTRVYRNGSSPGDEDGGAGGDGRIRIEYETSLTGTTSPAASILQTQIPLLPAPVGSSSNGILVKGDLTAEVKWLSGGTNPITRYAYDSFGNQTSVTDANNHTTTIVFDTTTATYPISQTNAKNQTSTISYDLGTGNLLSKIDPNNLTTTYAYDTLGRLTKEIKPYDSSSYPTVSYAYFADGIAPEVTLISKREVSGTTNTLDVYTWVDGFGRTLQSRAEAEDATKQIVRDTFYDPTGEVKKQTVPYLASSSAITITPTPIPSAFGDGSNGDLIISANTTESPIDSSVTATAAGFQATVGTGLGFVPNQIVLLHQTQGTNAGLWEISRVQSYVSDTLVLTTPLINSYSSIGGNHAQIRVVPQYHNVIVNSGTTWTAKAWNGTTGGILAFLANGTVTNNGIITAANEGFRGGLNQATPPGIQGEGSVGVGSKSLSANSSGGGGGGDGNPDGGGGGGGNGLSGSTGLGTPAGAGGSTSGTTDLSSITFGGGGGGGAGGGTQPGGNGGGIILITGSTITNSGSIISSGDSPATESTEDSNGGGGAGGSILLKSQTVTLGTNLINAIGGNGGIARYNNGGNGGAGRIRIEYENTLSGTTNPAASIFQKQAPPLPGFSTTPSQDSFGNYVTPDPSAKSTEFTYDPLVRTTIVRNPKGNSKTVAYDHWKETTIDENGHIKRTFRNAYNRISKVEEVNGVNTYTTNYTYNTRDDLTQITDQAANNFNFVYDTLGRRTSQTDPDMGTWNYTYDNVSNLLTKTDARNITTSYAYDELDRKTSVNYPTDTDTVYTYDGNSRIGTLTSITDSTGTTSYSYDDRLRKIQEQKVMDGITFTTQFAYDALDRLTSRTNPDNTVEAFTFNNQGEIDSLTGILNNIDYNAQGKITKKDFANSISTNYSYNTDDFRLNRIQTLRQAQGEPALLDNNYTYDNVGNVLSITDNLLTKTQNFIYDDLDRLTSAQETGGYNYSYEYNPIGNLTKFTDASSTSINYIYGLNAGPHAMTGAGDGAVSTPTPTAPAPTPTPTPSFAKFGDGSNGDLTISSNTTETPIDSFVTAISGANTATVGVGLGFMPNQIVLFHQTQGAGSGIWEYGRVQSYSGTTLTLTTNLVNSYSTSGSDHAQVRVVPQYHDVTINSGVTLTAKAWNGTTGGILAFLANGTITVNGTIDVKGKGHRGGLVQTGSDPQQSYQGEGENGTGSQSTSYNGQGGGGAYKHVNNNAGGGGGGNGTSGSAGIEGDPTGSGLSSPGSAGGTNGTIDLATMTFGGGGGGAGASGSDGGAGGGILFVSGATLVVSGVITADGNGSILDIDSTGGGGAGGSILLKTQAATIGSSLITGNGGIAGPTANNAIGGNGGSGRIRIEYETSLTGTTNPSASTLQTQIPPLPGGLPTPTPTPTSTPTPTPTNTPTPTPTPAPVNAAPYVNPFSGASLNQGQTYNVSGSFTDPDSVSWSATVDYGEGAGPQPLTLNPDKTFTLSHQYNTGGTYTVIVVVTDNQFASGTTMAAVTVNAFPQIQGLSDTEINYQDDFIELGSITDPDSSSWAGTVDYGDGSAIQNLTVNGNNFSLNHTYFATGTYNVVVNVTDNQGATETATINVKVNAPPYISQLLGASINQGEVYSESGSFTDVDSISWDATVNYGDGSGVQPLPLNNQTFALSHVYNTQGSFTVTVSVTDNQGALGTQTATVNVAAPTPTPTFTPTPTPVNSLLSQNKPISASTQRGSNKATKANDGSINSYWEGQNNIFPAKITVDLGASHSINTIVMKLNLGSRIENIEILGSTDNSTFTTIVSQTNYTLGTVSVPFVSTNVRYVQLKVNSNNVTANAQMAEFEVWGQ